MKFLVMSLLVLSLTSNLNAAEKSKKVAASKTNATNKMKTLGTVDQETLDVEAKDKNADVKDETALYTDSDKMKVSFSCKTKDGHEIKQGEKGYDECLQKVKNDKNNPHDPNADIKVHLGN